MALTNERLRQMVFESVVDVRTKFIVEALAALLESQVGAGAVDDILDDLIPVAPNTQTVLFGHKLGDYSGLDRTTLKDKFTKPDGSALLDADVDDIFEALGVVTGTSLPFGAKSEQAGETEESSGQQSVSPKESEATPTDKQIKPNLAPTQVNAVKQQQEKKESGKK